jgi:hypothetical protein
MKATSMLEDEVFRMTMQKADHLWRLMALLSVKRRGKVIAGPCVVPSEADGQVNAEYLADIAPAPGGIFGPLTTLPQVVRTGVPSNRYLNGDPQQIAVTGNDMNKLAVRVAVERSAQGSPVQALLIRPSWTSRRPHSPA